MEKHTTLIIGANSGIAKALAEQIVALKKTQQLIVISRDIGFYQQPLFDESHVINTPDYQESTIERICEQIATIENIKIQQVFICHGVLHNNKLKPEKKLQQFTSENLSQLIVSNSIIPMLWLKNLVPLVSGRTLCKVVFFNARVGSISDNKLGGWYSYRASKAALNMLIKSASIELARCAKNIKLISFHPGTTDTSLSKPFQKNVPQGKLFTPEFVAMQLQKIVHESDFDNQASFVDWQGENIPW